MLPDWGAFLYLYIQYIGLGGIVRQVYLIHYKFVAIDLALTWLLKKQIAIHRTEIIGLADGDVVRGGIGVVDDAVAASGFGFVEGMVGATDHVFYGGRG